MFRVSPVVEPASLGSCTQHIEHAKGSIGEVIFSTVLEQLSPDSSGETSQDNTKEAEDVDPDEGMPLLQDKVSEQREILASPILASILLAPLSRSGIEDRDLRCERRSPSLLVMADDDDTKLSTSSVQEACFSHAEAEVDQTEINLMRKDGRALSSYISSTSQRDDQPEQMPPVDLLVNRMSEDERSKPSRSLFADQGGTPTSGESVVQLPADAGISDPLPMAKQLLTLLEEPVQQLQRALAATAHPSLQGSSELKILKMSLRPDSLGQVEVMMRRSGGDLRIDIQVSHQSAAEALRSDLEQLNDRLGGLLPKELNSQVVIVVCPPELDQAQALGQPQIRYDGVALQVGYGDMLSGHGERSPPHKEEPRTRVPKSDRNDSENPLHPRRPGIII